MKNDILFSGGINFFTESRKVNIVRDSTGVLTAQFLAEKDNPQK
jgi:hypothetical protein